VGLLKNQPLMIRFIGGLFFWARFCVFRNKEDKTKDAEIEMFMEWYSNQRFPIEE